MLYDNNPPYPHYAHLPYAKEPWKSLYVYWRLFTTLLLVPCWALFYGFLPRRFRPRASWNIRQIVNVKFTRRIYKVTEVAGVTFGTRDPTTAPPEGSLKETRFEWVDPLPDELRTGIVCDGVPFTKVGCYVWPKEVPPSIQRATGRSVDDETTRLTIPDSGIDLESGTADSVPLVGIYMHGGGYCHMSAHEKSGPSRIPKNLVKRKILHEVYSVEYRLLQVAPFPAVVQDAAAAYAHVVKNYSVHNKRFKIILIGDSSGGNLVLSLARWLRDEGKLPLPDGLLLLSPSCDTSHALPETLSSYIPRPNRYSDYLVDTPEPRALLQRTFLGFQSQGPSNPDEEKRLMQVVHSEYVSPCSPVVLKRWGHDVKQDPDQEHERNFRKHALLKLPTSLRMSRVPETFSSHISMANEEDSPYHRTSRFPHLFSGFPKSMIVCGDAERLVREVRSLLGAMGSDGVDVTMKWVPDACHDILIMNEFWWDRKVMHDVWDGIASWVKDLEAAY